MHGMTHLGGWEVTLEYFATVHQIILSRLELYNLNSILYYIIM